MNQAMIKRRSAILSRLQLLALHEYALSEATANHLRSFLAHEKHIFVTVDTVQRDLRAMEKVGTVLCGRHPTAGHVIGNGNWVADNGWSLVAGRWNYEGGKEEARRQSRPDDVT